MEKVNMNELIVDVEEISEGNNTTKGNIILSRSIWPDVDGPEGVNQFLKGLDIQVSFLLDSGIRFEYDPTKFDPYKIGEETLYLQDPITRDNLFHYYEGVGELVFENLVTKDKFTIPIYDDWKEIGMAGD